MTGRELIDWIFEHDAEDLRVIVQYRDSGGIYNGYDDPDPSLWYIGDVSFEEDPNCIVL